MPLLPKRDNDLSVPGQLGLDSETMSKLKKKRKKIESDRDALRE